MNPNPIITKPSNTENPVADKRKQPIELGNPEGQHRLVPFIKTGANTAIFNRETDSIGIEMLRMRSTEKIMDGYNKHQSIEITNLSDLECFHNLVNEGKIYLEQIQCLTIVKAFIPASSEDSKKIVDSLLNFITQNVGQLKNLNALKVLIPYQGLLTIPTFNLKLTALEIGEVHGALIIKPQASLKDITIEQAHAGLRLEKQPELEELSIHVLMGMEYIGSGIEIQPKLKSIQINVCSSDLSLENQLSLEKIEIKKAWGIVSMTKDQKALLNLPTPYNPCVGSGMIMITKSDIELAAPVPLNRLFTLNHISNVVGINKYGYIAAALFEVIRSTTLVNYALQLISNYSYLLTHPAIQQQYALLCQLSTELSQLYPTATALVTDYLYNITALIQSSFNNPTIFYLTLGLICLYKIVAEMQRIYSIEKNMMFFYE